MTNYNFIHKIAAISVLILFFSACSIDESNVKVHLPESNDAGMQNILPTPEPSPTTTTTITINEQDFIQLTAIPTEQPFTEIEIEETAVQPTKAIPTETESSRDTTTMNNVILLPRLNMSDDDMPYDEFVIQALTGDLSQRLGVAETAVSLVNQETTEVQLANPCGSMQTKQDESGPLGSGLMVGKELTFSVDNNAYRYVVAGAKAYYCS